MIDLTLDAVNSVATHFCFVRDHHKHIKKIGLQGQIGNKGLSDAEIPGFLQAAEKRYSDPYTDQPMQWDPATHSLFFRELDKRINTSGYVRLPIR